MTIEDIARACHEVNRTYCQSLGDTSQLPWDEAPEWQKVSATMGVQFHLDGDHGPEDSHNSWLEEKTRQGWAYGPVKDVEQKRHPCFVPYEELPAEQRAKDLLFIAVVTGLRGRL